MHIRRMVTQAVVLVGGVGTRLGNLSRTVPKPMQDVGGVPFLQLVLSQLRMNGVRHAILTVGHLAEQIEAYFGEGKRVGIDLEYYVESHPLGTGGALGAIASRLDDVFALVNGDTLFDVPIQRLRPAELGCHAEAVLALRSVSDAGRYGSVEVQGRRVVRFGEKGRQGAGLINGGVGVLRRRVAESIEGPCSVEEQVYPALLARGVLVGIPFSTYFIDIGIPEDLARARRELPTGLRRPLALLDRDGVINVDHGHVHRVEDFEWLPGIADAIRLLNDRGYRVAIITNQAGIAKGYYRAEEFRTLTDWMLAELLDKQAVVNCVYHCPHHPLGVVPSLSIECDCRKPRPGMLLRALADLMAVPQGSFVLGDKDSDVLAATAAGIRGYLHDGRGNVLSRISEILDEVSGHEVARG